MKPTDQVVELCYSGRHVVAVHDFPEFVRSASPELLHRYHDNTRVRDCVGCQQWLARNGVAA